MERYVKKRFVQVLDEFNEKGVTEVQVWADSQTGVNYLIGSLGEGVFCTPLLNSGGKPLIKYPPEQES